MRIKGNEKRKRARYEREDPKQESKQALLRRKLEEGVWEIRRMRPDGNCLWRSASDQLYGDPEMHEQVRQQVVRYMQQERLHYKEFTAGEDFDAYLAQMEKPGVWGGHPEINAMAELYGRPVEVYAEREGRVTLFEAPGADGQHPLRFVYTGGQHYDSIFDSERPAAGVGVGLESGAPVGDSLDKQVTEQVETESILLQQAMQESEEASLQQALLQSLTQK